LSSSSRFARDLLGCLRFGDGDPSRTLESLQLSLDAGGGSGSHEDDDEETGDGVAERRNMANVALCLASMGDPDAPVELLLHAWTTLSSSGCRKTARTDVAAARPAALLLSRDACEMELASSSVRRLRGTKLRLLWKLYQAVSLARDWCTCLIATEEMQNGWDRDDDRCGVARRRGDVARVFALLQ